MRHTFSLCALGLGFYSWLCCSSLNTVEWVQTEKENVMYMNKTDKNTEESYGSTKGFSFGKAIYIIKMSFSK